jgi:hypothetical protein
MERQIIQVRYQGGSSWRAEKLACRNLGLSRKPKANVRQHINSHWLSDTTRKIELFITTAVRTPTRLHCVIFPKTIFFLFLLLSSKLETISFMTSNFTFRSYIRNETIKQNISVMSQVAMVTKQPHTAVLFKQILVYCVQRHHCSLPSCS